MKKLKTLLILLTAFLGLAGGLRAEDPVLTVYPSRKTDATVDTVYTALPATFKFHLDGAEFGYSEGKGRLKVRLFVDEKEVYNTETASEEYTLSSYYNSSGSYVPLTNGTYRIEFTLEKCGASYNFTEWKDASGNDIKESRTFEVKTPSMSLTEPKLTTVKVSAGPYDGELPNVLVFSSEPTFKLAVENAELGEGKYQIKVGISKGTQSVEDSIKTMTDGVATYTPFSGWKTELGDGPYDFSFRLEDNQGSIAVTISSIQVMMETEIPSLKIKNANGTWRDTSVTVTKDSYAQAPTQFELGIEHGYVGMNLNNTWIAAEITKGGASVLKDTIKHLSYNPNDYTGNNTWLCVLDLSEALEDGEYTAVFTALHLESDGTLSKWQKDGADVTINAIFDVTAPPSLVLSPVLKSQYGKGAFYGAPTFSLSLKNAANATVGKEIGNYLVVANISLSNNGYYGNTYTDTIADLTSPYTLKEGWKEKIYTSSMQIYGSDTTFNIEFRLKKVESDGYTDMYDSKSVNFCHYAADPTVKFASPAEIYATGERISLNVVYTNALIGDEFGCSWLVLDLKDGTSQKKDTVKSTSGTYSYYLPNGLSEAGDYTLSAKLMKVGADNALTEWNVSDEIEFTLVDAATLPEISLNSPTWKDNSGVYVFTQANPAFGLQLSNYTNVGAETGKYCVLVEVREPNCSESGGNVCSKYFDTLTTQAQIENCVLKEGWKDQVAESSSHSAYSINFRLCQRTAKGLSVLKSVSERGLAFEVSSEKPVLEITTTTKLFNYGYISLYFSLKNSVIGSEENNVWVAWDFEHEKSGQHRYDTLKSGSYYYKSASDWTNGDYTVTATLLKIGETVAVWEGTEAVSYEFTLGPVGKPVFSVPAGVVDSGTKVTISCEPYDAKVRYSVDGKKTFVDFVNDYSRRDTIEIVSDTVIYAYGWVTKYKADYSGYDTICSDTISVRYTLRTIPNPPVVVEVAEPTFLPVSGSTVKKGDTIRISCTTEGAEIFYALGKDAAPSIKGSFVVIAADTTYINALAMIAGEDTSAVVKAVYYVKGETPVPPVEDPVLRILEPSEDGEVLTTSTPIFKFAVDKLDAAWNVTPGAPLLGVSVFEYGAPEDADPIVIDFVFSEPLEYEVEESDALPDGDYELWVYLFQIDETGEDFDFWPANNQYGVIYDSISFRVKTEDETAIEKTDEAIKARVYPNPSTGIFNVAVAEACHIDIFTVSGVKVASREVAAGEESFELANSGLYFVKLTTVDGRSIVKRVIVK